ncbi:hypothetical protein [Nocardia jejuensis]|uniref:hypothetical protein n=1 Tax=Nocardia jejuensis TaxID=328049 RepID=UPI0012FCC381|nr:hypothetical protein [Nocardia jejuensis]
MLDNLIHLCPLSTVLCFGNWCGGRYGCGCGCGCIGDFVDLRARPPYKLGHRREEVRSLVQCIIESPESAQLGAQGIVERSLYGADPDMLVESPACALESGDVDTLRANACHRFEGAPSCGFDTWPVLADDGAPVRVLVG